MINQIFLVIHQNNELNYETTQDINYLRFVGQFTFVFMQQQKVSTTGRNKQYSTCRRTALHKSLLTPSQALTMAVQNVRRTVRSILCSMKFNNCIQASHWLRKGQCSSILLQQALMQQVTLKIFRARLYSTCVAVLQYVRGNLCQAQGVWFTTAQVMKQ